MLTLDRATFQPMYPLQRTLIAPRRVNALGGGAMQLTRRYQRPLAQFTLRNLQQTQAQAEKFFGFAAYHQGDIPFLFDGAEWGTVTTPVLFGEGNGVQTQFMLPGRHITTGTVQTYTNGVADGALAGLDLSTGLATYASPPTGVLTATYTCVYHCVFWVDPEVLLTQDNFAKQLYRTDGVLIREVLL